MSTFVINPHGRLQEWIAREKGYFEAAGLTDYELRSHGIISAEAPKRTVASGEVADNLDGAYQTYESGRDASISCACHWTVNMAASAHHGKLWGEAYSISPCAIVVPESSSVRKPEDLSGVPVHVGYQSGSHYTTVQALEPFMPADSIKLTFGGTPTDRIDQLIDGLAPAATVFGPQLYIVEQLGFRKILDCTFMIAAMIPEGVSTADVRKYYAALRMAQADIDVMHQPYVHYYERELPERHLNLVDVRRFGPGERIVFEPYTESMYRETREWIEQRDFFEDDWTGSDDYRTAVLHA